MPDSSTPIKTRLLYDEAVELNEMQNEKMYLAELSKTIERGLEDVQAGRTVAHEDVGDEMQIWLNEEHE